MQKKTKPSQTVTKTYLKNQLKKELAKFATKKDLEMTERSLRVELKLSILGNTQRIEEKIKSSADLLPATFDPLLKELEQRQQDRELASDQTALIRSQVEDHEKRIQTLEQVSSPA